MTEHTSIEISLDQLVEEVRNLNCQLTRIADAIANPLIEMQPDGTVKIIEPTNVTALRKKVVPDA